MEGAASSEGLARAHAVGAGLGPALPPGLANGGRNNCFLNAALQCMWHCKPFLEAILALLPHYIRGIIFCARCSLSLSGADIFTAVISSGS